MVASIFAMKICHFVYPDKLALNGLVPFMALFVYKLGGRSKQAILYIVMYMG